MTPLQIPGLPTDSVAAKVIEKSTDRAEMFKNLSFDDMINKVANDLVQFAIHLAIAILVFYVGRFVIRKLYALTHNIMVSRNVDQSLTTFVLSLVRMVLYFILIVTVIGILGIETSSFIALFASAGVAIGMALSGTLQNFAGGVLILLLKPYRVGNYIETQGYAGTVTEIQIFNTIICTPDNKSIIIPNGTLSTSTINNWSREDYRRIEWTVGISYGDSVESARKTIVDMLMAEPLIVKTTIAAHRTEQGIRKIETEAKTAPSVAPKKRGFWQRLFHRETMAERRERIAVRLKADEPELLSSIEENLQPPMVALTSLGDSSVNLVVRAWAPTADYWTVYFRYLERFYNELPSSAGISFPFPQMDVHLPKAD